MRFDLALARAGLCLAVLVGAGCAEIGLAPHEPDREAVRIASDAREPSRVTVRHVLIAFDGAKLVGVTRSLEKAERVATNVFEAAQSGRPFDELVRLYSDDGGGNGEYTLSNWGVPQVDPDEMERGRMVRDFHRAAFSMDVGEIRLVPYDEQGSPLGFHIIQRVR